MPSFTTEPALFGISHEVEFEIIWLFEIIRRQCLSRHIERPYQMCGHNNEQFRFILLEGGAPKQRTENRNIAESRVFVNDFPHVVAHEPADRKTLSVSQLNRRRGPPRRDRRNDKSLCAQGILEIQLRNFWCDVQTNVLLVHDIRRKDQADTELLKLNRDQSERLRNRDWKLAAGEKSGLLTIQGYQRRFSEHLDHILLMQSVDEAGPGDIAGLELKGTVHRGGGLLRQIQRISQETTGHS